MSYMNSSRQVSSNPNMKRHRYIPMKDRVLSDTVPLSENPNLTSEEKSRLLTIEDLLASASGGMETSRWALVEVEKAQTNQRSQQPSRKTQTTANDVLNVSVALGDGFTSSRWVSTQSQNIPDKAYGVAQISASQMGATQLVSAVQTNPQDNQNITSFDSHCQQRQQRMKVERPHYTPPPLRQRDSATSDKVKFDPSMPQTSPPQCNSSPANEELSGGGVRISNNATGSFNQQSHYSESPTPNNHKQSLQSSVNRPIWNLAALGSQLLNVPANSSSTPVTPPDMDSAEAWLYKMGILKLEPCQPATNDGSVSTQTLSAEEWLQKMGILAPEPSNSSLNAGTASRQPQLPQLPPNSNPKLPRLHALGPESAAASLSATASPSNPKQNSLSASVDEKSPSTAKKDYVTSTDHTAGLATNSMGLFDTRNKYNVKQLQVVDINAGRTPNRVGTITNEQGLVSYGNRLAKQTVLDMSDGWDTAPPLLDPKLISQSILADIKANEKIRKDSVPLTEKALVQTTGFAPRESADSFNDRISDAGVAEHRKEIVRATQGKDAAEEFLDWDGKTWLPPPVDWENDRGTFDLSFVPAYIREWSAGVPCGPNVTVDMNSEIFRFGISPVINKLLGQPIPQPHTIPDIEHSQNENKRMYQSASIDSLNYQKRVEKRQRSTRKLAIQAEVRHQQIMSAEPEPNPNAPTIDTYLRPATSKDIPGIKEIYNYYTKHSIVPEDQEPLEDEDVASLLRVTQDEKVPFVVAISGRLPLPSTPAIQGRFGESGNVTLPQMETVIGFAFIETHKYGLKGRRVGRSRYTGNIQLYVHDKYKRKGIGRSLFDRVIQTMCSGYAARDGYSWINPQNNPVYQTGGGGHWHQLLVELPVETKNDPNYPWIKAFFKQFFFHEEAVLRSVARSSIHPGPAKWLDIVIFQGELSHGDEFDSYV